MKYISKRMLNLFIVLQGKKKKGQPAFLAICQFKTVLIKNSKMLSVPSVHLLIFPSLGRFYAAGEAGKIYTNLAALS